MACLIQFQALKNNKSKYLQLLKKNIITVLFPPVDCSDSWDSSSAFEATGATPLASGVSTLFQSSPSATMSAIKAPTLISLASSGT